MSPAGGDRGWTEEQGDGNNSDRVSNPVRVTEDQGCEFHEEITRLLNKCTPEKKKKCAKDCGPHLEFACKTCEASKEHEPSEWFNHIWFLYALQRGGYPFKANDLTVDEWLDIGLLKDELEAVKTSVQAV